MAHPPLEAIVFDLDDTLVPSTLAYAAALTQVAVPPQSAEYLRARAAVKSRLGEHHPSAHNRLLYFKELLGQRGDASPTAVLALMHGYEQALLAQLRAAWLRLGREPLLGALGRTLRLGLLSNENLRTQLLKMTVIDPDGKLFSAFVTSEELGVEKPDRAPFAEVLRRLGVAPEACAMVGDSARADIEPALALGMRAVLTTEFAVPTHVPSGCQVIARLSDLPASLDLPCGPV